MKRFIVKPSQIIFLLIVVPILFNHPVKALDAVLQKDSVQVNRHKLYTAIGVEGLYYGGSMLVLQNAWYKGRQVVPFHFFNDNQGYLQVDKFGHAFGAYAQSYVGYLWLKKIGLGRTNALLLGGTLGFILQSPIEIMDGIHEGWGFSWGDMIANASGSALVIGQELLFNEQIIKYKFSYSESSYSTRDNDYLGKTALNRFLKDYNGHTYWLSMPVNRMIFSDRLPQWLNIALGYGANGMFGEFENIKEYNGFPIAPTERYRQYLLSLDIDWTRIKTRSKILKMFLTGMTFVKLPFPALEFTSNGMTKAYWLYY